MLTLSRRLSVCVILAAVVLSFGESRGELGAPQPSVTPVGPQNPVADAIADAVDAEGKRAAAIRAAYAERRFEPIWLTHGGEATPALRALRQALAAAPEHGLPQIALANVDDAADPAAIAAAEVDAARAFIAYAHASSTGLLKPRSVDRNIRMDVERAAPQALLAGMAAASEPSAFLEDLLPERSGYDALRARFGELTLLAAKGGWGAQVPKGRLLREGDSSPRVKVLRERLTALGDHPAERNYDVPLAEVILAANDVVTDAAALAAQDPLFFDAGLAASVRAFQARHGLNEDGVVGPATLAQINATAAFRAQQILVNLERMRWLNRDLGARHVMVNLADFRMNLVENGETTFTSRTVIGKARKHETPEFSDEMEYMVVNPTWHIPHSIASEEILPKLREDPGYLERNGMRLTTGDEWGIDWHSVTPDTFPGRLAQAPGRGNALGRVKFMLPNDYSIYLHDTPSRSLFRRDIRAYSHGCVRVEKPLEFAYALLAADRDDPHAAMDRWLSRGKERWVHFDAHIPVHITYRTAWIDADGRMQFRGDVYGRDRKVLRALEAAGVSVAGT